MVKPVPKAEDQKIRDLASADFRKAKSFWFWTLTVKGGAVLLGVVGALNEWNVVLPVVTLALLGELLQWLSENNRSNGESLQRKIDLEKSFGWPISAKDRTDALSRHSENVELSQRNYFSGRSTHPPRRAMENLMESAWYSREQYHTMAVACWFALVVALVLSLLVLIGFDEHLPGDPKLFPKVGRTVAGVISFVVSLSVLKTAGGYTKGRNNAEKAECAAEDQLKQEEISEVTAIRLWQEYHLSRASTPVIPDAVWYLKQDRLNKHWEQRCSSIRSPEECAQTEGGS